MDPSNQAYSGQRSLSSATNAQGHPDAYAVHSSGLDHGSQRHPYNAAYQQQQVANVLPQPGYAQAYQGQVNGTAQAGYSASLSEFRRSHGPSQYLCPRRKGQGAGPVLRELPFSNVRVGTAPGGHGYQGHGTVAPSASGSFSGQIQPLRYNSVSYGAPASSPYPPPSSSANAYIPTPAQTMQNFQNLAHGAGSMVAGSSSSANAAAGVERFPCDKCDRSFSRSHDRKRHYESHHLQTPHLCPTCGKDFSRSDSLKRHIDNGCDRIRGGH